MYAVTIISMPTSGKLETLLIQQAQLGKVLVHMAVDPTANKLILVFESKPDA